MQKFWNVIQRTLVTGASVSVMAWVASQYVSQKPIAVNEVSQKPDEAVQRSLSTLSTNSPVSQKSDEPANATTIDIPLPPGRIRAITQNVVISGGKITSASATIEQ